MNWDELKKRFSDYKPDYRKSNILVPKSFNVSPFNENPERLLAVMKENTEYMMKNPYSLRRVLSDGSVVY